ncbi:hypothetical protein B0H13DRAFT_52815 [Mycena leptocephala]|nr:hypothetical protein B0H13DRAFT_52815 [Mycena leptocephala]
METNAQSVCKVFALIIEAVQSAHWPEGCINDAKDFQDFLEKSLHVSESHIKLITTGDAARANILNAFKIHLINNTDTRAGHSIVFFLTPAMAIVLQRRIIGWKGRSYLPHDEGIREMEGARPAYIQIAPGTTTGATTWFTDMCVCAR